MHFYDSYLYKKFWNADSIKMYHLSKRAFNSCKLFQLFKFVKNKFILQWGRVKIVNSIYEVHYSPNYFWTILLQYFILLKEFCTQRLLGIQYVFQCHIMFQVTWVFSQIIFSITDYTVANKAIVSENFPSFLNITKPVFLSQIAKSQLSTLVNISDCHNPLKSNPLSINKP